MNELLEKEKLNELLLELAKRESFIARKEADMNAKIQKIKEKFDAETEEARKERKFYFDEIERYAFLNKKYFDSKVRSAQLIYGKIGFRIGTPKVMLLNRKYNWKTVLELLKKVFGKKYVRTKEEPNKEAIISDAAQKKLDDAQLAAVGLKIDQNEKFFVEIDWEALDSIEN